ncbi:sulfate adenylyltransferase subunit CysN [Pantoea sp. Aalb]|uniref:sulfate adenylyltransferase subunit CysN n=1 Tax=Pantoea sp. Aalb TaxID=2576762 RepID=UPI00132A2379|nr:sulfate adenylyltransferase subunit CysN [Pantoea sp. Aalb]MXP67761.1 sulfate adenylyltransferase subunit CysN [Pantoea sp. Aalb]
MNMVIAQQKLAECGGIKSWLKLQKQKSLLRFLTCGSVDDGKSTLIGRLLHDTFQIYEDHLLLLKKDSKRHGTQEQKIDFSLLVDGLQAEREQGITIDVAYRYFSTEKRKFIIADTPGHEQYTRNMVTGASTCELAILLIDVRKGILNQTRRHSFISTLLGIKHLVVAINKMDLVDYNQEIFEKIKLNYLDFSAQLSKNINILFIPISALKGENIVKPSKNMAWYFGPTLLEILETIEINYDISNESMRFPVQYVNRLYLDFRGYSGTLAAGIVQVGQYVKILPSGIESSISRIVTSNGDLQKASVGEAITLVLNNEIDISRGNVLVDRIDNLTAAQSAIVDVVWMAEQALYPNQTYEVKIANKKARGYIDKIIYQIEINTLEKHITESLPLNSIGLIEMTFDEPMILDSYKQNSVTGGMIFIDQLSNATVGAGMINQVIDKKLIEVSPYSNFELELNSLVCNHFPHWGARNLSGNKQ